MRSLSLLLVFLAACHDAPAAAPASAPEQEVAEARALFETNIKAIQERNREQYLACYRSDDERLVRAGNDGVKLGYRELADGTAATGSDEWPERLDASDMQLHSIAPGVVYGAYRYRVTIKGATRSGLSERVFTKRSDGKWQISVSTAFDDPPPVGE